MSSFTPVDWSACITTTNMSSFNSQIKGDDNADAFGIHLPRLVIVEEPQEKFRFRYRSEMMGTHGCILGRRSDRLRKRYPEVKLTNYTGGPAIIRCSLVAFLGNSKIPVPHAHRLTVRVQDVDQEEPQEIVVDEQTGYTAVFQGMGIVHTAKRYVVEELVKKKRRELLEKIKGTRSNDNSLSVREEMQIKEEAQSEAKMMNLNIVNLCFEAFSKNMYGILTPICDKVYSTPISNMKSAQTGELKICRIDKIDSSCLGGETIFILVEKVAKKNIMVRFFELDNDEFGQEYEVWEDFGKFTELDVHHQYAVVFKTPRYRNINIEQPKDVFLQLYRPSDKDSSDPIKFTYKPREAVGRKRLRHQISYDTIPTAVVQGFSHQNDTGLEAMLGYQPSTYDVNPPINEKVQATSAVTQLTSNLFLSVNSNAPNTPDELNGIRIEDLLATQTENFSRELSLVSLDALNNLVMDCSPMEALESYSKTLQEEINRSDEVPEKGRKCDLRNRRTLSFSEQLLKQICEFGANVDSLARFLERRTVEGNMTLHLVVQHCKISLLEKFLIIISKKKLLHYIDKTNSNKQTCLHLAVVQKEWEKVELLLKYGAKPEMKDCHGNTAYHLAISGQLSNGSKQCVKNRCMEELLNPNNYEKSRFQISNLNIFNEAGLTPLHLAVENEDLAAVEALVKANCDVNCFDIHGGCSALYMAILAGNSQIVRTLLSHPTIDVDYCCRRKMNPLKLTSVIHGSNSEIMRLLREKMNISEESACQWEEVDSSDDEKESPNNEDQTEKSSTVQQVVDPANEPSITDIHGEPDSSLFLEEEAFAFLSDILDKSGKWKDLAKLLEYDFLVLAIQEHSSPTRSLLSYADVHDDVCMGKMKEILKCMGEERAAEKIGKMMVQK